MNMSIDKLLNTIGKTIFVKYYCYFKDYVHYSTSDFLNIIKENYTDNSKRTRASHAHMIFYNNLQIEALNIITRSKKLSNEVKQKAQDLLNEELL